MKILLLAQHVSGTTMPIIRSSSVLYSGYCLWYLVLWFSSCWSGVELRVMCPVCRMLQHPANRAQLKFQLVRFQNVRFPAIRCHIAAKPLRKPKISQVMCVVKTTACVTSSRVRIRRSELPKTKTRGKGCRSKAGLYSDKNGRGM